MSAGVGTSAGVADSDGDGRGDGTVALAVGATVAGVGELLALLDGNDDGDELAVMLGLTDGDGSGLGSAGLKLVPVEWLLPTSADSGLLALASTTASVANEATATRLVMIPALISRGRVSRLTVGRLDRMFHLLLSLAWLLASM